ncbi:hypothetical protein N7535_006000 [Penicillium sp. DV-2018c]|nr:hypothetical protein N7461_009579 [Penicillium sp. DV-2018c]KAJ5572340.1 hypothetical protein N7535_006000 [Penicillium sp. DV-2018c]
MTHFWRQKLWRARAGTAHRPVPSLFDEMKPDEIIEMIGLHCVETKKQRRELYWEREQAPKTNYLI